MIHILKIAIQSHIDDISRKKEAQNTKTRRKVEEQKGLQDIL